MGQGGKVYGIIMAGGRGERMGSFTNTQPKALYPVLGKPLILHQILLAKEAGITDIVVSEGYLAGQIQEALGDGSSLGVEIKHFVETDYERMGNAGVIKSAMGRLNLTEQDQVVVFFCDIYSDIDIKAALRQHQEKQADITLITIPHEEPLGICRVDQETRQVDYFIEKPNEAASGLYIFSGNVWEHFPDEGNLSVDVFMPDIKNGSLTVYAYKHEGFWYHVITEEDVSRIESDFNVRKEGRAGDPMFLVCHPERR
jgi:NDP-sugar pyrophosphorylase family protein